MRRPIMSARATYLATAAQAMALRQGYRRRGFNRRQCVEWMRETRLRRITQGAPDMLAVLP